MPYRLISDITALLLTLYWVNPSLREGMYMNYDMFIRYWNTTGFNDPRGRAIIEILLAANANGLYLRNVAPGSDL